MVRYPSLLALSYCWIVPANAHPGRHAAMDGGSFASHVAQSPFHLAFLVAAVVAAIALATSLFVGGARRKRVTNRRS